MSSGGKRNGKKETEDGEKDEGVKKNGVEDSEMMKVEVGEETRQACITLGKLFVKPGEGNTKDLVRRTPSLFLSCPPEHGQI